MQKDYEELLQGLIDVHVHAYPDGTKPDTERHAQHSNNRKMIRDCMDAGMAGLVLKGHIWPTIGLAQELNSEYEDFELYPSIALSATSGGPNPWVAEMAIGSGAKVMWLAGWGSPSDYSNGHTNELELYYPGFKDKLKKSGYMERMDDLKLTDKDGNLKDSIKEIIQMCKEKDVLIQTGHCTAQESLAVGRFAKELNYHKLGLTHPSAGCSLNTVEQMKEFAEMGHYVELVAMTVLPFAGYSSIPDQKKIVDACGADHCYVSSDYYYDFTASIPVSLIQYMGGLYQAGVSWEELKAITSTCHTLLD